MWQFFCKRYKIISIEQFFKKNFSFKCDFFQYITYTNFFSDFFLAFA